MLWLGLIFHVHVLHLSCLWHVILPRKALQPASKAKHFCKAHANVLRGVGLGLLGAGEYFLSLRLHIPSPLAGCASRLHLSNTVKCVEVVSTPSSLTAPSSSHHCCPVLSSLHCPPALPLPPQRVYCAPSAPCWGGALKVSRKDGILRGDQRRTLGGNEPRGWLQ